jgi:hypothetical protein
LPGVTATSCTQATTPNVPTPPKRQPLLEIMAELFAIGVNTVNYHLKAIFAEGELRPEATIRYYRIVRTEGARQITRQIEHYNLEAILAVGFRVRSHRGTQFRQWAIGRLKEYLVKGFTMDDERLKNPPGKGQKDYFDEQLERIRDIRSSDIEHPMAACCCVNGCWAFDVGCWMFWAVA